MKRAGWVLVGGRSARMGRDKALLPYLGRTLVEHVAAEVETAAGKVGLIGDPQYYGFLGYPTIPDSYPGCGPIGGIEAALAASVADWNLVVACDMPGVTARFLARLLDEAERCGGNSLVPVSPSGRLEPLCAAYSVRCLPVLRSAIRSGIRKLALALDDAVRWPVSESCWFENLNTPEQWEDHIRTLPGDCV